ncbi:MAG: hypothetical protein LLF94_06725 [Chlamydiales bacterium]|nr:hypothetical protein [Chlamydiales bacterium]
MDPHGPLSSRLPENEINLPSPVKKQQKTADVQISKTFQRQVKPLPENGGNKKAAFKAARVTLELTSPVMQMAIHQVERSLQIATSGQSLEERLENMPEIPGSKGINGAYFVGPVTNRLLLVKPAIQEPGMPGCTRSDEAHPAQEPGKSAIRERLAYALQQETGIPFGVPESTVHLFSHEMFGLSSSVDKALFSLNAFDFLSRQDVVNFVTNSATNTFCPAFKERLTLKLQELVPDKELYDQIRAFIDDPNNKNLASLTHDPNYVEVIQTALRGIMRFAPAALIKPLFGLLVIKHNPDFIEQAGMAAYNGIVSGSQVPVEPTFCSAQAVEHGCISFDSIAYNDDQTEMELVPKLEFEKVLFDLLVFSMDRHLANILARKITVDQIRTNILHADPKDKNRLQAMLDHAKKKGSEYVYELILIDHGGSFPDPTYNMDAIEPMMDWKYLNPANEKISPATKARISKLDPAAIAQKLKKEAAFFEQKYGKCCHVSIETIQFQQFCCMVLQEAIRQDKTLSQIAQFYEEKLPSLYQVKVHSKKGINWASVQKKIKITLSDQ